MSLSGNYSEIVHCTHNETIKVEFFDAAAVILGFNKTTGDYGIFRYLPSSNSVDNIPLSFAIQFNAFFQAQGDKTAFVIGCNNETGFGMDSQKTLERFTRSLNEQGVNVLNLEQHVIDIHDGLGKYHYIDLNPANGECTVRSGQEKLKFNPFSPPDCTFPSQSSNIKYLCDFCDVAERRHRFISAPFRDTEEIEDHIDEVLQASQLKNGVLARYDNFAEYLKSFFNCAIQPIEGTQLIPMNQVGRNKFETIIVKFTGRIDELYAALAEVKNESLCAPVQRKVEQIKTCLKTSYEKLFQVATAESMPDLARHVQEKLAAIRNFSNRGLLD